MAGGVALNCTANGVIQRSRLFDRTFVQPAAGDDGTAIGSALYVHANQHPETRLEPMDMPYWGPEYADDEIGAVCRAHPDCRFDYQADFTALAAQTAEALTAGQVVAWFQGGMEFGPRALGIAASSPIRATSGCVTTSMPSSNGARISALSPRW